MKFLYKKIGITKEKEIYKKKNKLIFLNLFHANQHFHLMLFFHFFFSLLYFITTKQNIIS